MSTTRYQDSQGRDYGPRRHQPARFLMTADADTLRSAREALFGPDSDATWQETAREALARAAHRRRGRR